MCPFPTRSAARWTVLTRKLRQSRSRRSGDSTGESLLFPAANALHGIRINGCMELPATELSREFHGLGGQSGAVLGIHHQGPCRFDSHAECPDIPLQITIDNVN